MENKKNICVIGGGFAGISAATYLSDKGHNVYVLEKNSKIGGRARKFTCMLVFPPTNGIRLNGSYISR